MPCAKLRPFFFYVFHPADSRVYSILHWTGFRLAPYEHQTVEIIGHLGRKLLNMECFHVWPQIIIYISYNPLALALPVDSQQSNVVLNNDYGPLKLSLELNKAFKH